MSKKKSKAPPSAFLGVNAAAALTQIYYQVNAPEIRANRTRLAQPTIIGIEEIEATFLKFLLGVRDIAATLKAGGET